MLQRNHLGGFRLGLQDIRHAADDAHSHLFSQTKVIEAGRADDQAYPCLLDSGKALQQGTPFHHQFDGRAEEGGDTCPEVFVAGVLQRTPFLPW